MRYNLLHATAGWHSHGYLPHFEGDEIPQFVTFRLADSLPRALLDRWHWQMTLAYIEENPVKAGLCVKPED